MLEESGYTEGEDGNCIDLSFSRLEEGISCTCRCILHNIRYSVGTTRSR